MTISLPLKHIKAPIMSIYNLNSYYMPTNMTDNKKPISSYTKLLITKPYLLISEDLFVLLNEDVDKNTIQYDHMYVQTTPILLFRHTSKTCYINIIEHTIAESITSTCVFSYYNTLFAM